jgi:hypothetical protein
MDQQSLQFHIQENDYFGTLATVLDLIRQDLNRHGYNRYEATLASLRDDLVHLQQSHHIEEKDARPRFENRRAGSST